MSVRVVQSVTALGNHDIAHSTNLLRNTSKLNEQVGVL